MHVGKRLPRDTGRRAWFVADGIHYPGTYLGGGYNRLQTEIAGRAVENEDLVSNQGSVVRSWLLELAERAFEKEPDLASIRGCVEDSGEGRWAGGPRQGRARTRLGALAPDAIPIAPGGQLRREAIAALRNEFGGHALKPTA